MSCHPASPWRPTEALSLGHVAPCLSGHPGGQATSRGRGLCRAYSDTWLGPREEPVSGWVSCTVSSGFAVRTGKGLAGCGAGRCPVGGGHCGRCTRPDLLQLFLLSRTKIFLPESVAGSLERETWAVMNQENVGTQAHWCSLAGPRGGVLQRQPQESSHAEPWRPPQSRRPGPGRPRGQPVVLLRGSVGGQTWGLSHPSVWQQQGQ